MMLEDGNHHQNPVVLGGGDGGVEQQHRNSSATKGPAKTQLLVPSTPVQPVRQLQISASAGSAFSTPTRSSSGENTPEQAAWFPHQTEWMAMASEEQQQQPQSSVDANSGGINFAKTTTNPPREHHYRHRTVPTGLPAPSTKGQRQKSCLSPTVVDDGAFNKMPISYRSVTKQLQPKFSSSSTATAVNPFTASSSSRSEFHQESDNYYYYNQKSTDDDDDDQHRLPPAHEDIHPEFQQDQGGDNKTENDHQQLQNNLHRDSHYVGNYPMEQKEVLARAPGSGTTIRKGSLRKVEGGQQQLKLSAPKQPKGTYGNKNEMSRESELGRSRHDHPTPPHASSLPPLPAPNNNRPDVASTGNNLMSSSSPPESAVTITSVTSSEWSPRGIQAAVSHSVQRAFGQFSTTFPNKHPYTRKDDDDEADFNSPPTTNLARNEAEAEEIVPDEASMESPAAKDSHPSGSSFPLEVSMEQAPDATNTSTESSSSSRDKDGSNSAFDLKELEAELRSSRAPVTMTHFPKNDGLAENSVGSPKLATLTDQTPVGDLHTPVAVSPGRPVDMQNGNTELNVSLSSKERAITPIMRMRNVQGHNEVVTDGYFEQEPLPTKKEVINEDQYKAMKQKKWKAKLKLAKKRMEEQRSDIHCADTVDSRVSSERSHRRRKRSKNSKKKGDLPFVPQCRSDITEMFEGIVCGILDDTLSEDEYYSSDEDESSDYTEDESYDDGTEAETIPSVDELSERKLSTRGIGVLSATSGRRSSASGETVSTCNLSREKGFATVKSSVDASENKQFVQSFTLMMTKTGIGFKLHKKQTMATLIRSVRNTVLLRPGTRDAMGHFTGPKLAWKADKGIESEEVVDLFDIRSVEKADVLSVKSYPLAIPSQTVVLQLSGEIDYVFEMDSEESAVSFVHGMRWLIARLAFNLIIGNISVSCELVDVDRAQEADSYFGMFPSSVKEEVHWTMAMNDVTSHLVDKSI